MALSGAPVPSLEEVRALASRREWQRIVERVSAAPAAEEPEVSFHHADALRRVGRTPEALQVAEGLETPVRQRGDRRLLVNLVNLVGICLFELGRNDAAGGRFEELLELSSDGGDEEFAGRACNNLGMLANIRGERDHALAWYGRAVASYQRLGYTRGLAQTHHNLGISYRDLGFDRDADTHFGRAVELSEEAGLEDVMALAEAERAGLRVRWRDGRLAGEMARRALERFRRISDPTGAAQAIRILGLAALAEGDATEAEVRLGEALEIARAHEDALLHAEVQRDRGMLLRDRGDASGAREALADAVEHFERIGAAAEAEALRVMISALP